ncbi:hypothetical protein [Nostoc commune]|uniref:hypothetical protein n=1 Tax=Nostoc commune TaxID=1178 RepID=UPI0020733CE5|nr:hypothetical protein [Nostoc commune]
MPCLPQEQAYGVHTSREIPPDTWFRPLAIGLCDRSEGLSLRTRVRLVDKQSL